MPAKVAINEAIELAKTFGSSTSSKFVNGVLGAVYIELGEPGKQEQTGKRKGVTSANMPIEYLSGAVVFARHEGDVYLAFVHDIFGHWTISKGKVQENEEIKDGAIRSLKEEMNLDITIVEELGVNEYIANDSKVEGPFQGVVSRRLRLRGQQSCFRLNINRKSNRKQLKSCQFFRRTP